MYISPVPPLPLPTTHTSPSFSPPPAACPSIYRVVNHFFFEVHDTFIYRCLAWEHSLCNPRPNITQPTNLLFALDSNPSPFPPPRPNRKTVQPRHTTLCRLSTQDFVNVSLVDHESFYRPSFVLVHQYQDTPTFTTISCKNNQDESCQDFQSYGPWLHQGLRRGRDLGHLSPVDRPRWLRCFLLW